MLGAGAGAAVAAQIIGAVLQIGGQAAAVGAQSGQSSSAKAESKLQQRIINHSFNKQMVFENELARVQRRKQADAERQGQAAFQAQKGQQAQAVSSSQTQQILDRINRNPRTRQATIQSLKRV